MSTIIGRKIKQLRLIQKKKLKDLSNSTGLSISYLSKLERENYTASPDSLKKIAAALEVSMDYFYEEPSIIRSYERQPSFISEEKVVVEQLTESHYNRVLGASIISVLPGNVENCCAPHSHPGEEIVYVLEGVLTAKLNEIEYTLYPGDCLHFPTEHSHIWMNKTNQMVRILNINNTPDIWQSYVQNKAVVLEDE